MRHSRILQGGRGAVHRESAAAFRLHTLGRLFSGADFPSRLQCERREQMNSQTEKTSTCGYLAVPSSGTGVGLLVLHAWWGLNAFFRTFCDRLAEEGFVVFAPDFYDGAVAGSIAEAEVLVETLGYEAAQKTVLEALETLRQNPAVQGDHVGVIGFSMGAYWSVLLSILRPEYVAATVLFYGVGEGDFTAARCAYQGHFAETDAWEPMEQVQAMETALRTASREVNFYIYPEVGHWFFEENQPEAYDAEAAGLAWERTLTFLKERLAPGVPLENREGASSSE